jgi:predicted XRE-type DNA-binding protein
MAHREQALGEGVGSAHGWLVCLVSGGLDCRGWAAVADCRWGVFQQPGKASLAAEIARAIKARRLTQDAAANLLGIDQAKVSKITRGQFRGVSEEKLLELMAKLGHDVTIIVGKTKRQGSGKIELEFA